MQGSLVISNPRFTFGIVSNTPGLPEGKIENNELLLTNPHACQPIDDMSSPEEEPEDFEIEFEQSSRPV